MNRKILIVDDEEYIRSVLRAYLEEQGFVIFEARELAAARQHIAGGLNPDLIVCDVMLEDGNGIHFVEELRRSAETKEIPVIMMSAHRTKSQDKVKGLEIGADDYIAKPFDLRELHIRIENILKSLPKKNPSKNTAPSDPISSHPDLTTALESVLKRKELVSAAVPENKSPQKKSIKSAFSLKDGIRSYLKLLLAPRTFFSELRPGQGSRLGLAGLVCFGVLMGLQEGLESKKIPVAVVNILMLPLINLSCVALMSWIVQWAMGLRQTHVRFKTLFCSMSFFFAPLALSGLLGVLYVAAAGGNAGDFTAGPLLIFPSQGASKYIGFLLKRLDLFELAGVWLMAMALHQALGGSRKQIFGWCFSIWLGVVISFSIITGFFS